MLSPSAKPSTTTASVAPRTSPASTVISGA